jgi:hypothetical protein
LSINGGECSIANCNFSISKFEPVCKYKLKFFHSEINKYDNDGSKDIPLIDQVTGPVDKIIEQIQYMRNLSGD